MGQFDLNLSTRPFKPYRAANFGLLTLLLVLLAVSAQQLLSYQQYSSLAAISRQEEQEVRADSDQLTAQVQKLNDKMASGNATAKLSEVERLQKQLAKAEADKAAAEEQRKEQVLRTAVIGTAARLGFRDPEDAYRLLRPSEVEYDDTGEPSNIKPLLETMLKAKDYLVGARLPGGAWDGAAGGSRAPKPTDIETAVEAHYAKAGRT